MHWRRSLLPAVGRCCCCHCCCQPRPHLPPWLGSFRARWSAGRMASSCSSRLAL